MMWVSKGEKTEEGMPDGSFWRFICGLFFFFVGQVARGDGSKEGRWRTLSSQSCWQFGADHFKQGEVSVVPSHTVGGCATDPAFVASSEDRSYPFPNIDRRLAKGAVGATTLRIQETESGRLDRWVDEP